MFTHALGKTAFFSFMALTFFSCVGTSVAAQRPLSDFLSQQGSLSINLGGTVVHRYVPFSDGAGTYAYIVDYAGVLSRDLMANGITPPNSTYDGFVLEKALPDGTAEVTVKLHTSNAITMVTKLGGCPSVLCTPVFGYNYSEIFTPGITLPVGDVVMQIKFTNTAPGAPLPDYYILVNRPDLLLPNQKQLFVSITTSAFGPLRPASGLPDMTPGRAQTVQTGFFGSPGLPNNGVPDAFPVEFINVKAVGKE